MTYIVNPAHALKDYVVSGMYPYQGSGDTLAEVVSTTTFIMDNTVTWNGNGSITCATSPPAETVAISGGTFDFKADSFVVAMRVTLGTHNDTANTPYIIVSSGADYGSSQDWIEIKAGNYNTAVNAIWQQNYSNIISSTAGTDNLVDKVIYFIYIQSTGAVELVIDGTTALSGTIGAADIDALNVHFGVGRPEDEIYQYAVLRKTAADFTAGEITELETNFSTLFIDGATGPEITSSTNPSVDGVQSTISTSGLTGTASATIAGKTIALSGAFPTLTYTLALNSVSEATTNPRFDTDQTLNVVGDEGNDDYTIQINVASGWGVTELAGTLDKSAGSLLLNMDTSLGVTTAVTDQIYFDATGTTAITAAGSLTTDQTSVQMYLIQGGTATTPATWTPFTIEFGSSSMAPRSMSLGSIKIGF